jgi:serine/threonine protein kinase
MPKNPREINTRCPDNLSQLILKCLAKDKEKRFQGTEELLSELSNFEEGLFAKEKILGILYTRIQTSSSASRGAATRVKDHIKWNNQYLS